MSDKTKGVEILDAVGRTVGIAQDVAEQITDNIPNNAWFNPNIFADNYESNRESGDTLPQSGSRSNLIENRASAFANESAIDLNQARDASYNTVDFTGQSVGAETFNASELETSYQHLKELADSFTENNSLARKIVYDKITTSPSTSVLYGKVAVSATTSWDNNITATDNTDELMKAIAMEVSVAKASAVGLDGEMISEFSGEKSNGK